MYEKVRSGLGWSALDYGDWQWWLGRGGACNRGYGNKTREICFLDSEESTAHANACVRLVGGGDGSSEQTNVPCWTEEGNRGSFWCCPENFPVPDVITTEHEVYEEAREDALDEQSSSQTEPTQNDLPSIPGATRPVSVQARTFFEKLSHPGAIAALGVAGAAALLLYFNSRRDRSIY